MPSEPIKIGSIIRLHRGKPENDKCLGVVIGFGILGKEWFGAGSIGIRVKFLDGSTELIASNMVSDYAEEVSEAEKRLVLLKSKLSNLTEIAVENKGYSIEAEHDRLMKDDKKYRKQFVA